MASPLGLCNIITTEPGPLALAIGTARPLGRNPRLHERPSALHLSFGTTFLFRPNGAIRSNSQGRRLPEALEAAQNSRTEAQRAGRSFSMGRVEHQSSLTRFHRCPVHFLSKGNSSLSKVFGAIEWS